MVDDQIEALFKEGMRLIQIARTVPIGERCVRNCLKERGLYNPRKTIAPTTPCIHYDGVNERDARAMSTN